MQCPPVDVGLLHHGLHPVVELEEHHVLGENNQSAASPGQDEEEEGEEEERLTFSRRGKRSREFTPVK